MTKTKSVFPRDNLLRQITELVDFGFIYDLSDMDVVERSGYDMSFKYFLDMALLDLLIAKTVQIALEKGIIKSKSIIVDATHTK